LHLRNGSLAVRIAAPSSSRCLTLARLPVLCYG